MLMAPFCPEDSDGPISHEDALALIDLMRNRAHEDCARLQTAQSMDERCSYHHASGVANSLGWVFDLVSRISVSPEVSQKVLLESAFFLEEKARWLRRLANQKD